MTTDRAFVVFILLMTALVASAFLGSMAREDDGMSDYGTEISK